VDLMHLHCSLLFFYHCCLLVFPSWLSVPQYSISSWLALSHVWMWNTRPSPFSHSLPSSGSSQVLARVLRSNSTLVQLDLSHNRLGPNGAAALGAALRDNATLTSLNVGHCLVGVKGSERACPRPPPGVALPSRSDVTWCTLPVPQRCRLHRFMRP